MTRSNHSLLQRALDRVGTAQYLLATPDRLFSDSTNTWSGAFDDACAWGLHLRAVASANQGAARANQIHLYGVHPDFGRFSPAPSSFSIQPEGVLLNQSLAAQLGVAAGDDVLLRFRPPSAFSGDAPLSSRT